MTAVLHHGDCLEVMRTLPDNSVDAIVTDPPAGIAFMGKSWDHDKGGREQWSAWLAEVMREAYRVAKPGAHALVWALPRTSHWTACGLEDAGWEIRDRITHLFGTGFPKSLDVSKAIDKAAGATREVVGRKTTIGYPDGGTAYLSNNTTSHFNQPGGRATDITAPATDDARTWQGWGTALKPGGEDWWLARKPLVGTVSQNVLAHGTGALNIDGCRVATNGEQVWTHRSGNGSVIGLGTEDGMPRYQSGDAEKGDRGGRWPANVTLSEEAAAELDRQSGTLTTPAPYVRASGADSGIYGDGLGTKATGSLQPGYGDSGGASRFFYVAKAPTRERPTAPDGTRHPTVKPLALMRWLVRLVTPPGGTVLEPFAGSGTTVEACVLEGFHCIAIEREAEYLPLIQARLERQNPVPDLGPTVEDRIVEQVLGQLDLLDDEGAA